MSPLIQDGEFLLVNQWAYIFSNPKINDVVAFRHPENKKQLLCKRVADIQGDNYILKGDNQDDSLNVAPVHLSHILGRVMF